MKRLIGNLPLLAGAAVMAGFSTDLPLLRPLKTETTYGLWVAVLVPGAVVLMVVQLLLWIIWPWTRPIRRSR